MGWGTPVLIRSAKTVTLGMRHPDSKRHICGFAKQQCPHVLPRSVGGRMDITQRASASGRPEKVADAAIHFLGIAASAAAVATLTVLAVIYSLPAPSAVSLGIYGAGLAAVFSCSAAYHLTR